MSLMMQHFYLTERLIEFKPEISRSIQRKNLAIERDKKFRAFFLFPLISYECKIMNLHDLWHASVPRWSVWCKPSIQARPSGTRRIDTIVRPPPPPCSTWKAKWICKRLRRISIHLHTSRSPPRRPIDRSPRNPPQNRLAELRLLWHRNYCVLTLSDMNR